MWDPNWVDMFGKIFSTHQSTSFLLTRRFAEICNATVVMNTKDYYEKVHALLDEEDSYSVLKKDPTNATERKLLSILKDLQKKRRLVKFFIRLYTTIGRLQ